MKLPAINSSSGAPFTVDELESLLAALRLPPARFNNLWSVDRYDLIWSYVHSLTDEPNEWMIALYVDDTLLLKSVETVAIGNSHSVDVPVHDVFARALGLEADGIMLVHNHPAGRSRPSQKDFEFTRRMHAAADAIGIPLLEHFVIARDGMRRIVFDAGQSRFKVEQGFLPDPEPN